MSSDRIGPIENPPIVMVAAYAKSRVIGYQGTIPWRVPEDMQRFRALTLGQPIIMGRKTWDSLGHKALPGRLNIVLSITLPPTEWITLSPSGAVVQVRYIHEAISVAKQVIATGWGSDDPKICIIGGEKLYRHMWHRADMLYLTELSLDVLGDTYFPEVDLRYWELKEATDYATYRFLTYQRYRKEDAASLIGRVA